MYSILSTVGDIVMEGNNRLMNTEQVAELLGMKPQTLRMWTSQKKVSFTKLGSLVRFTPEQVEELINKGTVRAIR
jgi:excisionase family DNA binding protein